MNQPSIALCAAALLTACGNHFPAGTWVLDTRAEQGPACFQQQLMINEESMTLPGMGDMPVRYERSGESWLIIETSLMGDAVGSFERDGSRLFLTFAGSRCVYRRA